MPDEPTLGLQLQPVTVEVDGVTHHMHYGATEPEYVGAFPIRHDLVILPPDLDGQGNRVPLPPEVMAALGYQSPGNVEPPSDPSFGGHALEIRAQSATGVPEAGQVLVANSWGSAWGAPPPPDNHLQDLQADRNGGVLYINGAPLSQDITFYSKDRTEVLRITEGGDFIVQGRLVKRDIDVYNAFRVFLGMSTGMPPDPGSRDGIATRYERILKASTRISRLRGSSRTVGSSS